MNNHDSRALAAVRWRPQACYLRSDIPADLVSWLLDTASLTRRLQHLCRDKFQVRVLSQGWGRPRLDEARALAMNGGHLAIVRQVQLLCGNRPWVYARTVIPATSLHGRLQRLARLGTRPLGAMLFADPGMERGVVELARIIPGQVLFADAMVHTRSTVQEIWGRRSVFRLAERPLLVSEIFLPGFPAGKSVRPLWKAG